jgi:hypothetical protein
LVVAAVWCRAFFFDIRDLFCQGCLAKHFADGGQAGNGFGLDFAG